MQYIEEAENFPKFFRLYMIVYFRIELAASFFLEELLQETCMFWISVLILRKISASLRVVIIGNNCFTTAYNESWFDAITARGGTLLLLY